MSILKDLSRIASDVEKDLGKIGSDVGSDLAAAAKIVKDGLDEAASFLQTGFDDAEAALMKSKIADVESHYKDAITLLHTVWTNTVKGADAESIRIDITTMFTPGALGASAAASALQSLVTSDTMQASYKDMENLAVRVISVGAVGELDLGVGMAASGGVGVVITDKDNFNPRLLTDFSVSGGAEEGIEGGVFLAFWLPKSPSDLQGGFLAVAVEGVMEAGVGLVFYFDVSEDPGFIGAAVAISGGEEAEAGVELGFTLAFNPPS